MGPPIKHRISEEEVAKLIKEKGFTDIKVVDISSEFYGVIGVKK